MSRDWSCDHVVADHRDIQANTLAIDSKGQYAVLAGRRHMGVVHLDNPTATVCKINRHSKWDVSTAQWSSHQPHLFVIACNQRAELFCWNEGSISQQATLKAHTRAISDLDWAKFDPNLLATASIDTYIHLWDIRDHRKPSLSLSAVAGASQVKWNKLLPHMLATSHEGDIRLWDSRRCTSPVQYITAHLSKIHSIDWCPTLENVLATASQDFTVKFWDVTVPQKKDDILSLKYPVWRARYTPFGCGLVTAVVPPLRRGDNSLFLWSLQNLSNPVHTFLGHSDVVVEFGWRKQTDDSKEYQLVTWSKDQSLRIWNLSHQLQKSCGVSDAVDNDLESFQEVKENASLVSQTSAHEAETGNATTPPSTPSKHSHKSDPLLAPMLVAQPQNLQQEFSLVNLNIPNMTIDEMDATKRSCIVTAESGKYVVCLKLLFPDVYPFNEAPSFVFCKGTNVDKEMREKLLEVLQATSLQQVRRNRSCLEPCLRQLVHCLDNFASEEKEQQLSDSPYHREPAKQSFIPTPHYGFQDVSVPFPRTSGARFCGADLLVVFTRPPHLQRINAPTDVTPRSLSALAAYISSHVLPMKPRVSTSSPAQYGLVYPPLAHSPSGDTSVSISSFYHQDRKQKMRRNNAERRASGPKPQSNSGAVLIYSVAKLMPINKILAQNYVLYANDVHAACTKNASVAAVNGFKELVQVWTMAALVSVPIPTPGFGPDSGVPWPYHPCGRKMVQSLISYFIQKHDVQTASMLTCIFRNKSIDKTIAKKVGDISSSSSGSVSQLLGKWWLKPGGSPYHTVVPADNASEAWIMVGAALKRNRSNSWSDSLEEYRLLENGPDSREFDRDFQEWNTRLVDPKLIYQYDQFKKAYADILYRWNLLEQRAQILKYLSCDQPEKTKGMDCITECHYCHKDVAGAQCNSCKCYSLCCVICHLGVRGLSSFCIACGHGGHTTHMEEWFSDSDVCPSGCGCRCLEESNILGT